MKTLVRIAASACFLLAGAMAAQTNPVRTPVAFNCTCEDSLSSRYATKFRDLLAVSPRYIEVSTSAKMSDGKTNAYDWKVGVVSQVDTGTASSPVSIAVSIVITFDGFVAGHYVQTCGVEVIDSCASTVMANLDSTVHNF